MADIAAQVIGIAANLGLGVVVTALVARTLGQSRFGQWSTIFAVVQFVGFFTDLGLRQVVVRQIAMDPEREAQLLGAQLTLVMALGVPTAVLGAAVLAVMSQSYAMLVASLILSLGMVQSPVNDLSVVFQLRMRNDITTAITTIKSVVWAIAVVVIARSGGGLVAFAVCFEGAATIATVITAMLALRRANVRIGGARRYWTPLLRLALPVAVAAFFSLAYGRIDQVLVYVLAGSRDAGLYGAVYRILDQIQFVPIAVVTTLLPLLAADHKRDPARLRRTLEQAATYLSVVSLGALAVSIPAARPIVVLLFGPEFAAAAPALPVLMGAFVAICFGYLVGSVIVAAGLQGQNMRLALVALVVNVGLNLALIPHYGFRAAAWVTLVTELVWLALAGRMVLRTLKTRLTLSRIPRIILAAALTSVAVTFVRSAGASALVLLLVASAFYSTLLFVVRALTPGELRALVQHDVR